MRDSASESTVCGRFCRVDVETTVIGSGSFMGAAGIARILRFACEIH